MVRLDYIMLFRRYGPRQRLSPAAAHGACLPTVIVGARWGSGFAWEQRVVGQGWLVLGCASRVGVGCDTLRPSCDCQKQCVARFLEHPERSSLLEMWREQMQIRTLQEQNQQLLLLVKRIRSETRSSEASPVGWARLGLWRLVLVGLVGVLVLCLSAAGWSCGSVTPGLGIRRAAPGIGGICGGIGGECGISGESDSYHVADLLPRCVLPCLVLAARRGQRPHEPDPAGGRRGPRRAVRGRPQDRRSAGKGSD